MIKELLAHPHRWAFLCLKNVRGLTCDAPSGLLNPPLAAVSARSAFGAQ